jgi:hypothetical protein
VTKSSGTILDGGSRPDGRGTGTGPRNTSAGDLRARNLRTLAALAALFFLPLLASFWLYYGTGWRPAGHVNHGELITPARPLPAVTLPRVALTAAAAHEPSAAYPALFHGKWMLVYVGDGRCDSSCRQSLYVMRQTRLALGTEMTRVARVFLVSSHCCAKEYLAQEQAGIVAFDAGSAEGTRLLSEFPAADSPNSLFVVDPLGNLMMRYDVRRDPGGLLIDLKKLLGLSQIG